MNNLLWRDKGEEPVLVKCSDLLPDGCHAVLLAPLHSSGKGRLARLKVLRRSKDPSILRLSTAGLDLGEKSLELRDTGVHKGFYIASEVM
jgi:hypothetical protein